MEAQTVPHPAGWFYEWMKLDEKNKQPYAIGMKDESPFAFGGLWDVRKDKATGHTLETYTIVTTDRNELIEPIHNRMPVIVARNDYERWLAVSDPTQLPVDLLKPYPAEEMKAWKVGRAVGNVRNNEPGLVALIQET
jgi:putative SOS response-associated peptidase YedK